MTSTSPAATWAHSRSTSSELRRGGGGVVVAAGGGRGGGGGGRPAVAGPLECRLVAREHPGVLGVDRGHQAGHRDPLQRAQVVRGLGRAEADELVLAAGRERGGGGR